MKHLFHLSLFLVFGQTFAQFVTIPDPNFKAFLKSNYPQCFNTNDQMDTTCNSITSLPNLNLAHKNISNLDGIQYFDGLFVLVCIENNLTSLPKLPSDLKALICFKNKLRTLPELPSGLMTLMCASNNLTSLPNLPNTMTTLACDSNQLLGLPTLPLNLGTLKCNQNELKSLPAIPIYLTSLEANGNCLDENMTNPNPSVLKTFKIAPNRPDCGILTYLKKVTDDKYLVSYEKPIGTPDYGVSLLEYRCGYGYGTAELANIAEFHKKFVDFDDYKIKNLKRGILNGYNDTVTYNITKYSNGDTLRIPKADTVIVSADSRIIGGYIPESNWTGFCNFYIRDANAKLGVLRNTVPVPQKVIKYEARGVSSYLYYFPHKEVPTTTKPTTTKQVLADLKMYYKDTTFSFQNLSISCTNYLISDPGFSRRVVYSVPRVDSIILKIQEGKSNLKNIKLVYAIYNGNTSTSDRNYIVCDSISSFGNSDVILRHTGSIDKSIWIEGDSIHYQLIAEFDTIRKPVIFKSNCTIKTLIVKQVFESSSPSPYISLDIVHNEIVLEKSITLCGNYKVKANIVGDSINCLNNSKTYTAIVNPNDKSLAYVWKYNTTQSTFADFNVSFPSIGTKNMELTLTSDCGSDKATKSIQTITAPTKPSISQANNILTSNAATGNTWFKDGLLLPNETNKTLLITDSGKYKVTAKNNCGSSTSNEISVILTGIEDEYSTNAIQLFPNPMTSELFIEGLNKVYLAEIIDQFGSTVISKYVSDKNAINVASLTSGMYFLRLYDENRTLQLTSKLLKN